MKMCPREQGDVGNLLALEEQIKKCKEVGCTEYSDVGWGKDIDDTPRNCILYMRAKFFRAIKRNIGVIRASGDLV
jgi:hypothetical protein